MTQCPRARLESTRGSTPIIHRESGRNRSAGIPRSAFTGLNRRFFSDKSGVPAVRVGAHGGARPCDGGQIADDGPGRTAAPRSVPNNFEPVDAERMLAIGTVMPSGGPPHGHLDLMYACIPGVGTANVPYAHDPICYSSKRAESLTVRRVCGLVATFSQRRALRVALRNSHARWAVTTAS